MLRLEKLTKTYKTGDMALKAVDLDVRKGQVLALIGSSGAGKSTLIRCINRLVQLTSGTVILGGVEITSLGAAARAAPDGDDLSGIRTGRTSDGDGEHALRSSRLHQFLAQLFS